MSGERLEGVIRWSDLEPDLALISHSSGDYRSSYMDLSGARKPVNGDRVAFTPHEAAGHLKARAVEFKSSADGAQTKSLPPARAIKSQPPIHVKCRSCNAMVVPRHKRTGARGRFEEICPKCDKSVNSSNLFSGKLMALIVLIAGLAAYGLLGL